MDYHMAFDPDLGLNARDFVAAWNDTPECHALGEAQLTTQRSQGFPLDPQLVQQGLVLLTGVAGAPVTHGAGTVPALALIQGTLLSYWLLREPLPWTRLIGLVIALVGLAVLVLGLYPVPLLEWLRAP